MTIQSIRPRIRSNKSTKFVLYWKILYFLIHKSRKLTRKLTLSQALKWKKNKFSPPPIKIANKLYLPQNQFLMRKRVKIIAIQTFIPLLVLGKALSIVTKVKSQLNHVSSLADLTA
jgi:hypothetical protein